MHSLNKEKYHHKSEKKLKRLIGDLAKDFYNSKYIIIMQKIKYT